MKKSKKLRGGGCGNMTIIGELAPGIPQYGVHHDATCNQAGGAKNKSKKSRSKRPKAKSQKKKKAKIDDKKLDLIINNLCKSIKRKCTPKYKKLLKKIVIKNM